jgi:hypothetical protein
MSQQRTIARSSCDPFMHQRGASPERLTGQGRSAGAAAHTTQMTSASWQIARTPAGRWPAGAHARHLPPRRNSTRASRGRASCSGPVRDRCWLLEGDSAHGVLTTGRSGDSLLLRNSSTATTCRLWLTLRTTCSSHRLLKPGAQPAAACWLWAAHLGGFLPVGCSSAGGLNTTAACRMRAGLALAPAQEAQRAAACRLRTGLPGRGCERRVTLHHFNTDQRRR